MKRVLCALIAIMLLASWAYAEETGGSNWQNILFMGGDSRSTEKYERTDCMMIVSINEEEGEIKLTSIMRDTWVKMPGRSKKAKINAANVYGGPELAMETVNSCFGTDIDKYVLVNMSDLVDIVDLAGGVDLTITESERIHTNGNAIGFINGIRDYDGDTVLEHAGDVHMNGLLAVAYTRDRSTDSDYGRVMRQQKMLIALAAAFQNMDINDLMEIVGDVQALLNTNLDAEELKALAMRAMAADVEYIEQFRIPVDGTFDSGLINGTWKIVPDFDKNEKLLNEFIYGEAE